MDYTNKNEIWAVMAQLEKYQERAGTHEAAVCIANAIIELERSIDELPDE